MGRIITKEEVEILKSAFGLMIPLNLLDLLMHKMIIGSKFKLLEQEDKSGLGVNMQWLTPQEQIEESFQFYPGMIAIKKGYIPIGKCLYGSGDPYFIKQNTLFKVYRVPHDCVVDNKMNELQVEYICTLDELIMHRKD